MNTFQTYFSFLFRFLLRFRWFSMTKNNPNLRRKNRNCFSTQRKSINRWLHDEEIKRWISSFSGILRRACWIFARMATARSFQSFGQWRRSTNQSSSQRSTSKNVRRKSKILPTNLVKWISIVVSSIVISRESERRRRRRDMGFICLINLMSKSANSSWRNSFIFSFVRRRRRKDFRKEDKSTDIFQSSNDVDNRLNISNLMFDKAKNERRLEKTVEDEFNNKNLK